MKKTNRIFCMACLVGAMAFVASSCKKQEEKSATNINLPGFEEVVGDVNETDRAYLDFTDGNKFKWNNNDEIMVYNLNESDGTKTEKAIYATDGNAEGKTNSIFHYNRGTQFTTPQGHYFMFYPVSKVATGTDGLDKDNYETFTVAATQNYTLDANDNPVLDPTSMGMACEVGSLNESFTLKHIFGVCRLRLKGVKAVERIEIEDNSFGLAGNVSMKLHEVNMNTFSEMMNNYLLANPDGTLNPSFVSQWNSYRTTLGYNVSNVSKKITLNCITDATPTGVQLVKTAQTLFYFGVRPGAFIRGFKATVYFTDNTSVEVNNYNYPKDSFRIRAGVITSFSPAQVLGE